MGLLDPPPPSNMTTSEGKISAAAYAWFRSLGQNLAGAVSGLSTLQGKAKSGSFRITFPANQDYDVEISALVGKTITSIISRCKSGTMTATFKINGTALGGGANSVSTTKQTKTHTSANVIAVGDDFTCTVSANSSCQYAIFEIGYTET